MKVLDAVPAPVLDELVARLPRIVVGIEPRPSDEVEQLAVGIEAHAHDPVDLEVGLVVVGGFVLAVGAFERLLDDLDHGLHLPPQPAALNALSVLPHRARQPVVVARLDAPHPAAHDALEVRLVGQELAADVEELFVHGHVVVNVLIFSVPIGTRWFFLIRVGYGFFNLSLPSRPFRRCSSILPFGQSDLIRLRLRGLDERQGSYSIPAHSTDASAS